MKNKNYQKLAQEFREFHATETENLVIVFDDYGIGVTEIDDDYSFYYIEEVVDFCRGRRLSYYVTILENRICIRIF